MNHIIGLDAHSKFCEFAVYNKDKKLVDCKKIDTSEENLTEYIRRFSNPKVIIFEESTMAHWLYEIFLPYFDDVIVSEPYSNSLINKSEQKTDRNDSKNLVKLYLNNSIKRVYHTCSDILELRRVVKQYHSHVKDSSRKKNQIKAKYRENGISINTSKVYSLKHYKQYIEKIKSSVCRSIIISLMSGLHNAEKEAEKFEKLMKKMAKKHDIINQFMKIPGVGPITAITFFAILITPERFKSKKKLWTYCGLGISTKESGGRVYSKKLNKRGNPILKCTSLQATTKSISLLKSPFRKMYIRLVSLGLTEKNAKRTVARKIISSMFYMWQRGFKFDPDYIN